jgi:outer membrane scaffolding protein for murein synthesis (MipA/OmpV family)
VGISLGWIFYDFPRTGGLDTQELYAGASLNVPLSPSITLYRDIHEVDGTYINASIGHDLKVSDQTTLSLGAALGWGSESYHNGYFGVKDDSLSDYNLSAALAFALSDKITVTPMIAYSGLADDDLETAAELGFYEDDSNFYGGVNVSYSF